MNLTDGGEQPYMRDTKFVNKDGIEVVQEMTIVSGRGRDKDRIQKGMQSVLQERGLWKEGKLWSHQQQNVRKPIMTYIGLRACCKINNPNPDQKTKRIDNPACLQNLQSPTPKECCATAIIAQQPDYLAQRGQIQEIVEAAGHIVVLYPKFHCELNWIEYYWGACKRFTHKHCDYTLPGTIYILYPS
jgi:hypothetical protein